MKTRSEAQIAASRLNGAKSKGPKTPEGRRRSSQNALKLGLTGNTFLLAGDNVEQFEALRNAYLAEFAPLSTHEYKLVEDLAVSAWRLQRIRVAEAAIVDDRDHPEQYSRAALGRQFRENGPALERLWRQEARLSRVYERAAAELTKLRDKRAPYRKDTTGAIARAAAATTLATTMPEAYDPWTATKSMHPISAAALNLLQNEPDRPPSPVRFEPFPAGSRSTPERSGF